MESSTDSNLPTKKKKSKRPDVAARIKHRKEIEERAVCCSLIKRLDCEFEEDCRLLLREEIDRSSRLYPRLSID